MIASGLAIAADATPAGAAPAEFCFDVEAYSATNAPAGSGNFGDVGAANTLTGGEVSTLTGVAGGTLDVKITWENDHDGIMLDPAVTPDFVGLDGYQGVLGSNGVLRSFPKNDQVARMSLEFLWAGTSTPAPVSMTKLLMGGQREFTGVDKPFGVAEFTLLSGGAAGSPVAPTYGDPDVSITDSDSSDGIAGLGTAPIIELNDANFGVANNTAYNEARSSYVSVGALDVRDWTIVDWGGATGDTLRWDLYGSATNDPETVSLASAVPHTGLSAYIAGLCFVPPEYDLALIKTLDGVAPLAAVVGANLNFEITVINQGDGPSGAYTVTDTLPAGTSYVSDTSGATANVSGNRVSWTFGNLASAASRSFVMTVQIDDATLGTYRNDAEITSDSGADIDSDPASGTNCLDGWDNHNDPSSDTDGPGGACDDHDAEVVTLGATYSIGNKVWLDANNNGVQDSGETPLANIWMELFTDSNDDGMPDDVNSDGVITDADAVATTGTNSDGLYLFDSLAAGKYIVGIPPMEWETGQPLVGMISSTVNSVSTDANSDVDDDGRDGKDGYIMSTTIMLGDGEPTGETPDNDALTPDVNENLTVDFGFWTPQFDLALRKQLQSGANTGVVAAGDPVTFTIRVLNQGNVAAADITVVDYIPAGLTLNDSDWSLTGSTATIALAGVTLAPGESTTVDITFTVSGTSNSMVNLAEISSARPVDATGATIMTRAGSALVDIDSTPDANNSETPSDDVIDNTNGDEDDHDVASVSLAAQGPGGGQLPATGASSTGLWYPATIALLIGALLLVLERQRNRLASDKLT